MPKQVPKLNEAVPLRPLSDTGRVSYARERQRLADRLAELAPLTLEAVTLNEPVQFARDGDPALASEPADGMSVGVTEERGSAQPPPLPSMPPPIPKTALVVSQHSQAVIPVSSGALVRLNGAPPPLPSLVIRPVVPERRSKFGFLAGLSISIAVGAALYAALVSLS